MAFFAATHAELTDGIMTNAALMHALANVKGIFA